MHTNQIIESIIHLSEALIEHEERGQIPPLMRLELKEDLKILERIKGDAI